MKNRLLFYISLTMMIGCSSKKERNGDILSAFITAINAGDTVKAGNYLTNDFYFLSSDSKDKVFRSEYLKEKSDVIRSEKITLLSSQVKDSVLETHERSVDMLDSLLQINPRKIDLVEYTFRKEKISRIRLVKVVNEHEYANESSKQRLHFMYWLYRAYPEVAEKDSIPDLSKYVQEYLALPQTPEN